MKKPTIRWTIGPFSEMSMKILKISINNIRKLYGDRFSLTVTYNNVPESEIRTLPIDRSINQVDLIDELPIEPPDDASKGMAWKLYPPRTNIDSHEIMLDNDIIIIRKMESIERFLNSDSLILITEALQRSYSPTYINRIKTDFNINSGFVGLPPMLDYKSEIINVIGDKKEWSHRFDEQSIVACCLQSKPIEIIPRTDISVIGESTDYNIGQYGVHFIGINSGYNRHWNEFTTIKYQ